VSNLLGEIVDVHAITDMAHSVGARVVVDGVAYAPHRAIDVRAWDVDFYVYSTYKVFGPHMAAMFGKHEAWEELEGSNHFFLPASPYKFELGGTNHEGCAGLLALQEYFGFLGGASGGGSPLARADIERTWQVAAGFELPIQDRLCAFLRAHPRVRIVGPASGGSERVSTVSFVHETLPSPAIVAHTDAAGIGIRFGHMYAYRLCRAIGIDLEGGVVRVSMAHYNTLEEIERLIEVFDRVL
jgi:selenocysteine lyase/cysteine desulfurase